MTQLADRARAIWQQLQGAETRQPSRITIPADHIIGLDASQPFERNAVYFQVRVNEMYLTKSREWFSTYDPMVYVVSEFIYDKGVQSVPFVVGPALVEKFGQQTPQGMVFTNTRVAGLHPYRGGRLTLSVMLSRVERQNFPKQMLGVVESIAGAIDFSTALTSYVKVANALVDGVSSLLSLGGTQPLIGWRNEYDTDAGDLLRPTFFALIDQPNLASSNFWVRENQLFTGSSAQNLTPYRDADFVLYSVIQTAERSDERTLPFYAEYENILETAGRATKEGWNSAITSMMALRNAMLRSPDLTRQQARALADKYVAEIRTEFAYALEQRELESVTRSAPAAAFSASTELSDDDLRDSLAILDLMQ